MIAVEHARACGPLPADAVAAAAEICAEAATELARLLPALPARVVVRLGVGDRIIPGLGYGASALDRHAVRFIVAQQSPGESATLVHRHLRHALYHECHHIARGWVKRGVLRFVRFPRFIDGAISEGLASAFERDAAGFRAPWCDYPGEVAGWVAELLALPRAADYRAWMFQHPDGRRWVGYRAGTYIADCAIRRSGRSAAELATVPAGRILELAGIAG